MSHIPPAYPTLFKLVRHMDISGVSGTGIVAMGVMFPDGKCVMQWQTQVRSIGYYDNLTQLQYIHGHGGATEIQFLDGPELAAGQEHAIGMLREFNTLLVGEDAESQEKMRVLTLDSN